MVEPGPGIAVLRIGRGTAGVARKWCSIELCWDDDPPLPPRQQEVPGTHQVGISVELAAGVFSRGDHPTDMIWKIDRLKQIIRQRLRLPETVQHQTSLVPLPCRPEVWPGISLQPAGQIN